MLAQKREEIRVTIAQIYGVSQYTDLFGVGNEMSVEVDSQPFMWEVTTGLERDTG